ncbi:hypothetical protein J7K27_02560 [Candidatus Bathyarchaeota archaeon]|nr:hypothetical protein [Candidatus Bathyarchaeota archaeon]
MKIKYLPAAILTILVISTALTNLPIANTSQPQEPHEADSIWIEPSAIELKTTEITPGYKFNITIWTNLSFPSYAWQIKLYYNTTFLDAIATGYTAGATSEFFQGLITMPVSPQINDAEGYVLHGESLIGTAQRDPGYGSLMWIEFEVTAAPSPGETFECLLDIDNEYVYIMSVELTKPPIEKISSVFTYIGVVPSATTLYVDPNEIIDPTLLPPASFSINISIAGVENLKVCSFNLTYNTQILSWSSIDVLEVEGIHPSVDADLKDNRGYIWLNLTYPEPVTLSMPAALVKIKFSVEEIGCSVLDLKDTVLLNKFANPIPHDVDDGYFCTLIRDVAVINLYSNASWAYSGWPVSITATIKNLGNISESFDVEFYYDTNIIDTVSITDLPAGAEINVTVNWDTNGISEGEYTLKAFATYVPYEFNLENNEFVDGSIFILEKIHDLAITDLTLKVENFTEPVTWAYEGWPVNVIVNITNLGEYSETSTFELTCNGELLYSQVLELSPAENYTFEYTLSTSEMLPCNNYTITAKIYPVTFEYDLGNNEKIAQLEIRIIGDITGDGFVDVSDLSMAARAYGSYPGHSRWLPAADLNLNLMIEIGDIAKIARNYGKTC